METDGSYRLLRWDSLRTQPATCLNWRQQLLPEQSVLSSAVVFVFWVHGSKKVIQNKVSYVAAEPLTNGQVKTEMLSSENATQCRFFGCGREAGEWAFYAGEDFRGNVELETIPLEKGNQHLCSSSAYDRMRSWVGRVGGSLPDFREPIGISRCLRVVVGIASANGGHRSPQIVCVFGIVKGDHVIRKTKVKECKQPSTLLSRQIVG